MKNSVKIIILSLSILLASCSVSKIEQHIKIGWASTNITPGKRVQLAGHSIEQMSFGVHDSLTATAMAIESSSGDMQAIMVSIETLEAGFNLQKDLRNMLKGRLPEFDLKNLIINATHTHTAPYVFTPPDKSLSSDMMSGDDYRNQILLPRIADMIINAWNNRSFSAVGFAKGTADVGYCRICVYDDGHAKLMGSLKNDNGSLFKEYEARNDQSLNLMYCFDTKGNIKGIVVNIACPAQDIASTTIVSADFWSEVRNKLQSKYPGVYILEQCSPAGDQGPWDIKADQGANSWSRLVTHATNISNEVIKLFDTAQVSRKSSLILNNQVRDLLLTQKPCYGSTPFTWELHAIRIGDAVFANNPFELYITYGDSIKVRSKASQTFLVQLSGTASDDFLIQYTLPKSGMAMYLGYVAGYLPTQKAVSGGAYGSWDENGRVGPVGGEQLVNQTVDLINSLFLKTKKISKKSANNSNVMAIKF